MSEDRDDDRLVAWGREMRAVHERLRAAQRVAHDEAAAGRTPSAPRDLSHFRYEERTLLGVLDRLGLRAEVVDVLGPL